MSRAFDVVALARAIHARLIAFEREHERRALITPAMSRLLAHDETYAPYRPRNPARRRQHILNPTIGTLVDIAARLETSVGALLGEKAYNVGIEDRRELRRFVIFLVRLFDLDAPELRCPKA